MANTTQGISNPGPEDSVNTSAGFEAAMAAKGIEPDAERSADTDVVSGLTYDRAGNAHDAAGKFAPPQEPEEPEQQDEDPLEAFIAQHGGDRDAALAALYQENTNQRSVIGRQGRELGDVRATREEMAELRGRVEALSQFAAAPPVEHMSNEQAEEYATDLISRHGYSEAATQAANIVHSSGDDTLYNLIVDQWALEEPSRAFNHVADFRAWQRAEALAANQPAPAEPDTWVEDQKAVSALQEPLQKLMGELGEEKWAIVGPRMEAALDALPQGVAELIVNQDPETVHSGLQLVADRAYLMGLAENQQAETRQARKMAGAGVATSSLRPPQVSSSEITPDQIEAATQRFKQAILEEETTDVRSGLTYGKTTQPTS